MKSSTITFKATLIFLLHTCTVLAANRETIQTTSAFPSQQNVSVAVYGHNEIGLFEYFNLIVFDDSRLNYAGMTVDRGALWYGNYPTEVIGNKIYIHGWAGGFSNCLDPDTSEPGSPLLYLNFNVRPDADEGMATIAFASEPVFDGHWVNCSYVGVSPSPEYFDGGINIAGYTNHITIGDHLADGSGWGSVEVKMSNEHDVFEYFNQILFDSAVANVDSLVASRGALHFGFYPTHTSGDTLFVHGWANSDICFDPDLPSPGSTLYKIYFSAIEGAPSDYLMDLNFIDSDPIWNHWVGCDLTTTDSFTGSNGSIYFPGSPVSNDSAPPLQAHLLRNFPNPFNPATIIEFDLPQTTVANLSVFNLNGQLVRELVSAHQMTDGRHKVIWNGQDDSGKVCATGVYFYRLETEDFSQTKRMVLLK